MKIYAWGGRRRLPMTSDVLRYITADSFGGADGRSHPGGSQGTRWAPELGGGSCDRLPYPLRRQRRAVPWRVPDPNDSRSLGPRLPVFLRVVRALVPRPRLDAIGLRNP